MEVKPSTKIDFGELLLETAKNAKYLTPEMQKVISDYMSIQSKPVMYFTGKQTNQRQ